MSIKCAACGRFISHADMANGAAAFEYTPDSHYTCANCQQQNAARHDDEEAESFLVDMSRQ